MRLPPNRLIDWLPLLLFACSTPALAAQTWTTVWTPRGAPTIQATGGGGTHDSKTNCRPCEVWDVYKNSGQGGWDPLPAGTEPIQCAGDTNDYACKVCDGTGGVANATSGSNCVITLILPEPGKCCEGECWPIPQPGKDPCEWALDNKNLMSPADQNILKKGSKTMGYVLCVFGAQYPCTIPYNFPASWGPDMKDCILQEETNHLNSTVSQCPPCIGTAFIADAAAYHDEECNARAATYACMEGLKSSASSWYKDTIEDALDGIWNDMNNMGCTNLPPKP